MSTRLTQSLRKKITNRILDHGFKDREADLLKTEHVLALQVYAEAYPPKVQKAMKALPSSFFSLDADLTCYIQGRYTSLTLPEERLQAGGRETAAKFSDTHPIAKEIFAWQAAGEKLNEERAKALRTTQGILAGVRTVEKLVEVWPEIASFTTDLAEPKPVTALALPMKEINTALGLPPGAAGGAGKKARPKKAA